MSEVVRNAIEQAKRMQHELVLQGEEFVIHGVMSQIFSLNHFMTDKFLIFYILHFRIYHQDQQ